MGRLVLLWFHVVAAFLWIGGMLFLSVVLGPYVRTLPDPALRARLLQQVGLRFRPVGWACIAVLLVSGPLYLWSLGVSWDALWHDPFWGTLRMKLVLVAGMLGISVLHDFVLGPRLGRQDPLRRSRALAQAVAWAGRVNLLLGLGVVALALGILRA